MKYFQYPKDRLKIEMFFRHSTSHDLETERQVREIIEQVRHGGDKAVAALTRKLDGIALSAKDFRIPAERLKEAWDSLPAQLRKSLKTAHDRIREYHKRQMISGFTYTDALGNRMDQRVAPLRRACVYVPGGRASYPSTVLMDIVPARVAGVEEIMLLTPPGRLDEAGGRAALGAAWLAGVDEVISVGGTPGVAAAALGTESIKQVDIIVGPGNKWIAMAKRLLFGEVTIDMLAGPSEVLIIADSSADPAVIAADMLAQAEHDPDAQAVAILAGEYDAERLKAEIARQTADAPRGEIIRKSLSGNGAIIRVPALQDAIPLAEMKAPEHLEIMAKNARGIAGKIRNVGAIFLGRWTPESIGDYAAGPNHTLPTGGTARFCSPLSVWSFLKTSHVVECSSRGFEALADTVEIIAESEGFDAHANAVRLRRAKKA